jgi:hypothetical protein
MLLFLFQEVLEYAKYFRITGASAETTLVLALVVVISVLTGTGVWAIVHYGNLWMARKHHRVLFRQLAIKHNLTHGERQFLRRVARIYNLVQLDLLISSIRTFDRYMFRMAERAAKLPAEKRDRRIRRITAIREKLGYDRVEDGSDLQSTRELDIGHPVDIGFPQDEGELKIPAHVYANDEQGWILELEDVTATEGKIPVSAPLTVYLTMPDDAGYEIPGVIWEVDTQPVTRLCCRHTQSIRRIQHRRYPRMDVHIKTTWSILSAAQEKQVRQSREALEFGPNALMDGVIANLGGGGMAMRCDQQLEDRTRVHVTFALTDDVQKITGIIGLALYTKDLDSGQYLTYFRFVRIPELVRRQILRYLYKEMRKSEEENGGQDQQQSDTETNAE